MTPLAFLALYLLNIDNKARNPRLCHLAEGDFLSD